ncbi:MAG: flippase-like domain-containing protein [Burkholderiales bacterium]|jgi:uncharacterized membrane protein YbhN (UPF0104 family)|nr:flippase-like domain-containing protein [Burkholderiales bacterium]
MTKARIQSLFAVICAVSLFAGSVWYFVEKFQWRAALDHLQGTELIRLFVLVVLIQLAYLGVRAWRWWIVVRQSNPAVGFIELYWITAVTVSLSILTPGQLGETLKIELLKRRGMLDYLQGLGTFMPERILDLMIVAGIGLIGLFFMGYGTVYPHLNMLVIFLLAMGGLAFFLLLRMKNKTGWLARIRSASGRPRNWIAMGVLTFFSWGLVALGWQVCLRAIGIPVSFFGTLWLVSLVTLGTILSCIPGGFGVADIIAIEWLAGMGESLVASQAAALILRFYSLVVILVGLLHLPGLALRKSVKVST